MAELYEIERARSTRRGAEEAPRPPRANDVVPSRARSAVLAEQSAGARGPLPPPAHGLGALAGGRARPSLSDAAFGDRPEKGGDPAKGSPSVGAAKGPPRPVEAGKGSPPPAKSERPNGSAAKKDAATGGAPLATKKDAASASAAHATKSPAAPAGAAPSAKGAPVKSPANGSAAALKGGAKGGAKSSGGAAKSAQGGGAAKGAQSGGAAKGAQGGASAVPDGLVDGYMQAKWQEDAFKQALAQVGPSPLGDDGKPLLPAPEPSPGAQAAVQIAGKIASGLIDQVLWGVLETLPGVGLVPIALDWVSSEWTAIHDYGDLHDGLGNVLFLVSSARDTVNLGGSIALNLADLSSALTDAIHAGVLATAGIGAPLEALNAALIPLAESIRAISFGFDSTKTVLDDVLVLGDVVLAQRLEAAGNLDGAKKARELAAGNAFTAVGDTLAVVAGGIEMLTFGVAAGGERVAEGGAKTLEQFLKQETGKAIKEGALSSVGLGFTAELHDKEKAGDALPEDLKAMLELLHLGAEAFDYFGVTDPTGGGPYVQPPGPVGGGGQAAALIDPARAATGAAIGAAQQGLAGAPPEWYQQLIDDFLSPEFSYNKVVDGLLKGNGAEVAQFFDAAVTRGLEFATSPLAWVELTLRGVLQLDQLASGGDQSRSAIAALLNRVADLAPQAQTVVDGVNRWMAANKPMVDQMLVKLADKIAHQKISFGAINQGLTAATATLDRLGALTSLHGQISSSVDGLIDQAGQLKLDPAQLKVGEITAGLIQQLEKSVPGLGGLLGGAVALLDGALPEPVKQAAATQIQAAIDQAAAAFNAQVDALVAQARAVKTGALAQLNAFLVTATAGARVEIARFQQALADGGAAQTLLQAAYDQLSRVLQGAVAAFTKWNGQLHPDFAAAAAWLRGIGATLASQTESGRKNAWTELLTKQAQPYVTGWKAQHTAQVEEAYFPSVSPAEVGALMGAAAGVRARIDAWQPRANPLVAESDPARKASLRAAVAAIQLSGSTLAGKRGKRALQAMWYLESALAAIDRAVPGGGGAHHQP